MFNFVFHLPTHTVNLIVDVLLQAGRLGGSVKRRVRHGIPKLYINIKQTLNAWRTRGHEYKSEKTDGYNSEKKDNYKSDDDTLDGVTLSGITLSGDSMSEKHPPEMLKLLKGDGNDTKDIQVSYDHLIPTATGLHFAELVDMSHIPSGVEPSLFDYDIGSRQLQLNCLRKYTCSGPIKSKCGLCNIQICSVSICHLDSLLLSVRGCEY